MKPIDITGDFYVESNKNTFNKDSMELSSNKKPLNLKLVVMLEFQNINIFAKGYTPKNTVPWTYVINDLNGEEIIGSFYEKELQKTSQKEFRTEKVLKRKGNKLYVKWKGYDNRFNS